MMCSSTRRYAPPCPSLPAALEEFIAPALHQSPHTQLPVVAARLLRQLVVAGLDRLPLPGHGETLARWQALAAVAAQDLSLAKLFEALWRDMSDSQKQGALLIMKRNLAEHDDWIVLNNSMQVLFDLARKHKDQDLADWLAPHLERLKDDPRKSVASRAKKLLAKL